MKYKVDPRVDAYIASLPDWQRVVFRKVRDLVHAANREVVLSKNPIDATTHLF